MNTADSSETTEDEQPDTPGIVSLRVCAVMLVLYALYYARSLAVPVVTAFVIYMVLCPLVRQGKRVGIPPPIGAAGIILTLLIAFGLATYSVIQPAQDMIAEAPRHVTHWRLRYRPDRIMNRGTLRRCSTQRRFAETS